MTKKKRRQIKLTLTLSVMIASVPLSLALFVDNGHRLPDVTGFTKGIFQKEQPAEVQSTGKILPVLANK